MAHEFIRVDDNIIVNTPYAEAYIPSELFKNDLEKDSQLSSAIAYFDGDAVVIVGVFNMKFFDNENQSLDKVPLRTFCFPSPITTYPDEVRTATLQLGDQEAQSYQVLRYTRGDIMMSTNIAENSDNCEKFLNMMLKGKIPNTVEYHSILDSWEKNYDINGIDPGVPSVALQLIISQQAREAADPTKPFRFKIGSDPKCSETAYTYVNMRTLAAYTSVFNGLTFEDMGQMITTSINMTRGHKKQSKSPVETVLSM